MTSPEPVIVAENQKADGTGRSPRVGRLLAFLFPATTGLVAVYQGIQQILIPAQVAQLDPLHKVETLALMTTFVAITSMIGGPLGGALSDRTRSRYGRRAPWIVVTSVASGVLMIAMGYAGNLLLLGVVYAALWLTVNMYAGTITALLPDQVPEERRGFAASLIGLATPIGVLVGVQVAGLVSSTWGYTIIAIVLVVTAVALAIGAREGSSIGLPARPKRNAAGLLTAVGNFFSGFVDRDFRLAFISRFLFFLSYATVTGFLYFTLSDYVGVGNIPNHNVGAAVATLTSVLVIGWVVVATFCGWLSDKLKRRKLFVGISSVGLALTMFIPIVSPTWTGMIVYSLFAGVFIGTFFAVDLALMSLVLPNKLSEGRDLGILGVATGLPTILAGALAGLLITIFGGYTALYAFGAISALSSGVVVFFIRKVR